MTDPALRIHLNWLGYVQPVGLVVSPPALINAQCVLPLDLPARQATFLSLTPDGRIGDLAAFLGALCDWQSADLVPAEDLTDLEVALPDYRDALRPTFAVPKGDGEPGWQMLVVRVPPRSDGGDTDLDATPEDATPGRAGNGWRASPQARIERLLREKEIPVGLLVNDTRLRLVYAPRGESSGHVTFRLSEMRPVAGRPILGALCMLLGAERLFQVPPNKRLPNVLKESRKYQNEVSTRLAEQVLGALDELVRGFELADADRGGDLLRHAIAADPQHVYGGLITVLLRLVFLLYAEERALTPGDAVYVRHYSVSGLFDKLRADAGRFPDTMDQRFGAWAQLVSLFRLVHDGGGDGRLYLPARHGTLFDPERYAFLEGRPYRQITSDVAPIHVPRVPDGVLWRVLEKLLMLDGERLSYRALDVEQIGSVYEAMMGFELRRAFAPSLAVKPKRVVVSLRRVLDAKDRAKVLSEEADCDLTSKAAEALKAARTVEEVAAAIDKKAVDKRIIPEGGLYLQPGEERRRSGSHYTPRSLTEPIVRTTFRPILEALGPRPTPTQLLDLKVCDPAMGSGAFLVETCRQLGDALVEAWSMHGETPLIPPDEDPVLHARRLVAQRCLYGVDKNPFAVNLAKLSLWLVTLAKDHPFTFLDHSLKHGDSLVGLTKRQIGRFDWQNDDTNLPSLLAWIERQTASARMHRAAIQDAGDGDDLVQRVQWLEAEDAVEPARVAGDLCIAAFFAADKDKAREEKRREYKDLIGRWRAGDAAALVEVVQIRDGLRKGERPVVPFHWEVEFPEVFDRENGGFDGVVGNPPFAGKNTMAASNHGRFPDWLKVVHDGSHGNADLVAHFFRRAFRMLGPRGAFGLIATNTIGQGDTRSTGLRRIREEGGWIFDVTRRKPWPGAAAVVVSVVHVARAKPKSPHLDNMPVDCISSYLFAGSVDTEPITLGANKNGSFIGSYLLGMGFTFDDESAEATPISEMRRLVDANPRNGERIFPFIGYAEVADSPLHAHRRFTINFGEMTEDEARAWPDLFSILEERVKPQRMAQNRETRARYWWRYAETTPALIRAAGGKRRVLVAAAQACTHLAIAFLPSGMVYSTNLAVLTFEEFGAFGCLQSRPHEVWSRRFMSTLGDALAYTPSTCFETVPFPPNWTTDPVLESIGQTYYGFRAALMVRNNQGLTATYNRFHDPDETAPDILELRRLHAAMDRAVLDAYGWTDIPTDCVPRLDYEEPEDEDAEETGKKRRKKKPWRLRWPEAVHDEVLARLLSLNQQRAEEERKMASDEKPKQKKPAAVKPTASKRTTPQSGPSLFDRRDDT